MLARGALIQKHTFEVRIHGKGPAYGVVENLDRELLKAKMR